MDGLSSTVHRTEPDVTITVSVLVLDTVQGKISLKALQLPYEPFELHCSGIEKDEKKQRRTDLKA